MSGLQLSRSVPVLSFVVAALAIVVLQLNVYALLHAQAVQTLCHLPVIKFSSFCLSSTTTDRIIGLGPDAPWSIAARRSGVNATIDAPPRCRVDQVRMLAREAESHSKGEDELELRRLYTKVKDPERPWLRWLKHIWTRLITLRAGSSQTDNHKTRSRAKHHGTELRRRYDHLVTTSSKSPSVAVVDTPYSALIKSAAQAFAADFFNTSNAEEPAVLSSPHDHLAASDCTAFQRQDPKGTDPSQRMADLFLQSFLPDIVERVAKSGLDKSPEMLDDLDAEHVLMLHRLCALDAKRGRASVPCSIFTDQDWQHFEYYYDLYHFYNTGPGNRHGPAIGLALLNTITDALKNPDAESLMFYFVELTDIISMISALELLPQYEQLPADSILEDRVWRVSDIIPLSSRMIFERLACKPNDVCAPENPLYPNHVFCESQPEEYYIRININDAIFPISGCESGPGQSCRLDHFVRWVETRNVHMDFARKECMGSRVESEGLE